MATIATRAILNNRNLNGSDINMRESVASFCSTYAPFTDKTVVAFCERIGMDVGQGSHVLKNLEAKGELKRDGKLTYLLRLDDYQLEKIAVENFSLLAKLAKLGCREAQTIENALFVEEHAALNLPLLHRLAAAGSREAMAMVEAISKKIENDSTSTPLDGFLLQFFLFSKLNHSQQKLNHSQPAVESFSTKVESFSTAYKEYNVLNVSLNDSNVCFNTDSENPEPVNQANSADDLLPSFDSSSAGTQTNKAEESLKKGLDNGNNGNSTPATGKTRQPAKIKPPADGRKDHPAIRCVLKAAKRYPPKDLWDAIIIALGEKPDEEFYSSCYIIWRSVNGSPMNYERWLFEPARTGKSPHVFRPENGNGGPPNPGKPPAGKPKTVEKLSETERLEMLNWLKTKADWYFYDEQFTPDDWAWLESEMEKFKAEEEGR